MTQALNLANFANNLNTSGASSNAGLQNSSLTVSAGTGMSGGGSVALGSSVTLTNAGVTSLVAGTGISISGATGAVTVTSTATGTVTSVATGNGLSGGTITTTGTLTVACPTFNTVGSYADGCFKGAGSQTPTSGSNYAAGSGNFQLITSMAFINNCTGSVSFSTTNNLSGTWKWMASTGPSASSLGANNIGLICRVS